MNIIKTITNTLKPKRRIIAREVWRHKTHCIGTVMRETDTGCLVLFHEGGFLGRAWEHWLSHDMIRREYVDAPRWQVEAGRDEPDTVGINSNRFYLPAAYVSFDRSNAAKGGGITCVEIGLIVFNWAWYILAVKG